MKTNQTFIKIKFFLYAIVCVCLALNSCKKADFGAPGAISATVDGADVNLSTSAIAHTVFDPTGKEYVLNVLGSTGTGSSSGSVEIIIVSNSPIASGTYTVSSLDAMPYTDIYYTPAGAGANNYQMYTSAGSRSPSGTVTITSISKTQIQGTFTGTVTNGYSGEILAKAVTNGKFNVEVTDNN